jgi:RNA polymerase sigma factor (sigma-70 family)
MKKIDKVLLENLDEFVGFARRRLGDPELAADALQDSLLKALRAEEQLGNEESARAWFYRILRRTIIDLYRRRDAQDRALERLRGEMDLPPSEEETRMVECGKGVRNLCATNASIAVAVEAVLY